MVSPLAKAVPSPTHRIKYIRKMITEGQVTAFSLTIAFEFVNPPASSLDNNKIVTSRPLTTGDRGSQTEY